MAFSFDKQPIILAPMAGVTDHAFREMCVRHGADFTFTEMVSAAAVHYGDKKTESLARIYKSDGPCSVQIFSSKPDYAREAARRLVALNYEAGSEPFSVDINMGCPVKKIVSNGEGSALMREPALAREIVRSVKQAVDISVSVKIRAGWDMQSKNAPEFAKMLEDSGADFITVHGRTRSQMYSPGVDREIIAGVKRAVSIPVIANGDIFTPQDAKDMLDETGCDGIMIARGALGNPFIFDRIKRFLGGEEDKMPTAREVMLAAKEHLTLLCTLKGENAVREFRSHAGWYTKGMTGGAEARTRINRALCADEICSVLDELCEKNTAR